MPRRASQSQDLHGNVPDVSPVALLLIDVMNDLDFPGNEELIKHAATLGRNIAGLKRRCRRAGIPAIYVNDNWEKWRSDFGAVIAHCRMPESPGRPLVEQLVPEAEDYIVLKPKHSAFYATPLDTILGYLKVRAVILAGLTTAACVLLTAGEIYVRDLQLYVPSDCVAALHDRNQRKALHLMRESFHAVTTPSPRLQVNHLVRKQK